MLAEAGADDPGGPPAARGFGAVAPAAELREVLQRLHGGLAAVVGVDSGLEVTPDGPAGEVRVGVLAEAHRWRVAGRRGATLLLVPQAGPGSGAP